jgi:sugar (pentulose or hexulose) kinase
VLDGEGHVADIARLTTLAGYVHWQLTGRYALGVGDASGMFPIDSATQNYDAGMAAIFDGLCAEKGVPWKLLGILPEVLRAGDEAGALTDAGARLLDPSGALKAGAPLCPPEGDAGTGMVATNSVAERTGNVSAGTSVFAMVVLEKPLERVHVEIDMVATPSGKPVAMAHCNTCTTDIDAWIRLFREFGGLFGFSSSTSNVYDALYRLALEGDADCGGLLSYNYYAGEPVTAVDKGCPLFTRAPASRFTLANFMRSLLFSSMATLKLGMDILTGEERVRVDQLLGHGGLFKTPVVGQRLMAAALGIPIAVMDSAGEGGAWGIALLAAYMAHKRGGAGAPGQAGALSLESYLADRVFAGVAGTRVEPDEAAARGFVAFMERYVAGLPAQRAAATLF